MSSVTYHIYMSGETLHEVVWHALAMKTNGSITTITHSKKGLDVSVNGKSQTLEKITTLHVPGNCFTTNLVFINS